MNRGNSTTFLKKSKSQHQNTTTPTNNTNQQYKTLYNITINKNNCQNV